MTATIMARVHPLRNFAFHLETELEGEHHVPAVGHLLRVSDDQRGCERRHRRMSEQTVYLCRIMRHLRVIPIMSMSGRPQDPSGTRRPHSVSGLTQHCRVLPPSSTLPFINKNTDA